jgi:hypothetical protein
MSLLLDKGAISKLFLSFVLLSWSPPPLWASPENSWCLTNLFGIQWRESACLGKIQRKPLSRINTGLGPIHWFVSGSFHITRGWVCLEEPQNLSAADCPYLSTFKKFKTKRVWLSLLAGVGYSIPPFFF